jgi:hypothetical protein
MKMKISIVTYVRRLHQFFVLLKFGRLTERPPLIGRRCIAIGNITSTFCYLECGFLFVPVFPNVSIDLHCVM